MMCEWCGSAFSRMDSGGFRHCSRDCRHAHELYAFEAFDALFEDEDPPTRAEIDRIIRRSSRWDVDSMQQRIAELRTALRNEQEAADA